MGKYILSQATGIQAKSIDNSTIALDSERDKKLGLDILGCASYLRFHHYFTVDQVRLVGAHTCKKSLLCPFCARGRAAKMISRYKERLDIVLEKNPKLIPAFLTLTVKNGDDLDERYKHLKKSYTKLLDRRRNFKKVGRGYTELVKSAGGVHSFEFTNKGKGWHPHIHAVVLLDEFIDIKALTAEWKKITGDSCNTDLRLISKSGDGSTIEALLEVFKYALKFSELSLENNLEAYRTLKGQRLQSAYGCLWGVKVPENILEDELEGLPYIELIYRYLDKNGYSLQDLKKMTG
ncbi:MAG: protein rep [Flavobacteriaceae bacterium]|nr:protein rep [Flavobacteriaceae bacterium]